MLNGLELAYPPSRTLPATAKNPLLSLKMQKNQKNPRGRRLGFKADAKSPKTHQNRASSSGGLRVYTENRPLLRSKTLEIRSSGTNRDTVNMQHSYLDPQIKEMLQKRSIAAYQGEMKQTGMRWHPTIKKLRKLMAITKKHPKRRKKQLIEFKRLKAKEVIHEKNQNTERKYVWGIARGHRTLNVATINPDALNNDTIDDIIAEMKRRQIHIAGIQETHIPRNLDYRKGGYRIINSAATKEADGNDTTTNNIGGVAIILEPNIANMIFAIERIDNRIITITLDTPNNPIPVTIINTYAPHKGYRDEIRKEHWEKVTKQLGKIPKKHLKIWTADTNGQVGRGSAKTGTKIAKIIGPETHSKNTEKGNGISFRNICLKQTMCVTNTWYKEKKRNKDKNATWISPDGKTKRQIDYISINHKFKNAINKCTIANGWLGNMNQNRQHKVVIAQIQLRLKDWEKHNKRKESAKNNNNNDQNDNNGNGNNNASITYDKEELKKNPEKLEQWAKNEKQKDETENATKSIAWIDIKNKLNEALNTLYPISKQKKKRNNSNTNATPEEETQEQDILNSRETLQSKIEIMDTQIANEKKRGKLRRKPGT